MPPGSGTKIISCSHCGAPLNVTGVSPYTLVECTDCKGFTRTFSQLGNYHITSRLGIGGMSLVFRAKDKTLGREIALKVLNQTYSSQPERVKKFEHEAQVMALVSHPHVVKIYSVGESEGLFYIAMELVEGTNLEAKIADNKELPEREVLTIAVEIAEGLRAGYEAGVLHRDMKPANVLFNEKGSAQIVDFGLALLSGDQSTEEEIWATPHYASPEVLERKPEDLRSDIYALGATLYHVFTGSPPINSESQSIQQLLELKRNIPPLGEVMPGLSEEACLIVDKAMSFEPDKRFSSYDELIDSLKYAIQTLDRGAGRTWAQAVRIRKRNRTRAALVAVTVAVILLGGLTFIALRPVSSLKDTVDIPPPENPPVLTADTLLNEEERLAQRKAGEQYIKARELFIQDNYGEAASLYNQVFHTPHVVELTGAWAALEGYMAFLLEGEESRANDMLHDALAKFDKQETLSDEMVPLASMTHKLDDSTGLTLELCEEYKNVFPSICMASALRAWTKGNFDRAEAFFGHEAASAESESASEWDRHLGAIAQSSLKDLHALKEVHYMPEDTSAEVTAKIGAYEKIDSVKGKFARAYVAKQMDELQKMVVRLRRDEEIMLARTWHQRDSSEWKEGLRLISMREFDRAVTYFYSKAETGIEQNREVYRVLAEMSEGSEKFLNSIATYLTATKKEIKFKDGGGGEIVLKGITAGQPVLVSNGRTRNGKWLEIPGETMYALLRDSFEATREMPVEARAEFVRSALYFFYLSGMKSEAGRLVVMARERSPQFAEDWQKKREILKPMGI